MKLELTDKSTDCKIISNLNFKKQTMVEDVNALDLLQEEMRNDEVHLKVNAIHRMRTVIMSIGVEETNRKMVYYLDGKCSHGCAKIFFS